MSTRKRWGVALVLGTLVAGPALASGFSIFEQSAKASGQAGAWVARADDAASNWYNPAALLRQDGMQFQIGTNLIPIGENTDFTVTDTTYLALVGMTPPQTYAAEGNLATPSHIYFSHKASDRIAWGVGLNNPFGLITEWKDLPVTLSARKSELVTWVLNPNVAIGLGQWSVAVGADYMLADVTESSRDVERSELGLPPGEVVARSNLIGDGDAWGYNIALHRAGERWSFGLTYRSELSPKIEGDLKFSDISTASPVYAAVFQNTQGSAELDLPAQAAIGVAWHASDSCDVELDIAFAGWSSFERLAIDTEDPNFDEVLEENWDDTLSYRIGTAWGLAEAHELRFVAVYDEAPIPAETLRPSIPDGDRTGVSLGYGYSSTKWNLDAYLMPLWFADATAMGDAADGVIDGT